MKLPFGGLVGAVLGGILLAAAPAGATSVMWAGSSAGPVVSGWLGDISSYSSPIAPSATTCPGGICSGGSVVLSAYTFSGTGLNVSIDGDYGSSTYGFEAQTITVTTPAGGINAFFLQLGDSVVGAPITITLSDGEVISTVNSSALDSPTYFAIAISHDVTSFSITTGAGNVFLDEMYYGASSLAQDGSGGSGGTGGDGTTSPTSEAATFLMIGGGLLALLGSRRKWVARYAA